MALAGRFVPFHRAKEEQQLEKKQSEIVTGWLVSVRLFLKCIRNTRIVEPEQK